MSCLLLDTHPLIWTLDPGGRLPALVRRLDGDPGNEILFSTVRIWEIALKTRG
jgi:PIN domain nuclease of toxin-antitoxin system